MKRFSQDMPVSFLPGVGATREKQLNKLGIFSIKNLLYHFPRAYENRGNVSLLCNATADFVSSFILTIASEIKNSTIRKGLTISKCRAFDESGTCEIVFFNTPFIKDVIHIGTQFRFYAKPVILKKRIQLINPKYEAVIDGVSLPDLVPIYPLTDGISSKFIDKITQIAYEETLFEIKDPLPDKIRVRNSLPTLSYALKNIHFPESTETLNKALRRLAFDEMFNFGIAIALSARYKKSNNGIKFSECDLSPITNSLPYTLTESQKNAINDIYKDTVFYKSNNTLSPMARIIVGDVGCGKTICAIMAIYIAVKSNYQAALMAPTEILARQHFKDVASLLRPLGINVELLVGSLSQKEKRRVKNAIKSGECNVVVGTHALISDNVEFSNLALVVTDEQHRFGIAQRANLSNKAQFPHLLVMSATPIPRTLALALYGDLDISRITEMPKGRQRVDTFVVDESYRTRLDTFINKQVMNGGQCYIVCPAIERDDVDETSLSPASISSLELRPNVFSNLKNSVDYTETLQQKFPNLNIACLNGKIKSTEREEIMNQFSAGNIDVLVATTVIEVGVNVPNATLMIIENAERFGLSQLHQLRGRVGRGNKKSYCVLVSDSKSEKSMARLNIIKSTNDGYEIAEKDLALRGPGDFFATQNTVMRQSGGFEFKIAKLCDDNELFKKAFSEAKGVIDIDHDLSLSDHELIRKSMEDTILSSISTIS